MGLKLITPPASNPITLDEAKKHLRVSSNDDDTMITNMVAAATRYAEQFLGRAFVDQTWELVLDDFPVAEIKIPLPPLIEVQSVKYFDPNGDEQIVDTANYFVDNVSQPGWVVPEGNLVWPTTLAAINSVIIRFRAGYADIGGSPPVSTVPDDIKSALLLLLGTLYEFREDTVLDMTTLRMPFSADIMLRNYKVEKSMA